MAYGDGGFYFLQPVGGGYSGIEVTQQNRQRSFAGFGSTGRTRLEAERLGKDAIRKIRDFWKGRVSARLKEAKALDGKSGGNCFKRLRGDLFYDAKKCDATRFENYKNRVKAHQNAESALGTLNKWVSKGQVHVYGELPSVVQNDAATVEWIRVNLIEPRYAVAEETKETTRSVKWKGPSSAITPDKYVTPSSPRTPPLSPSEVSVQTLEISPQDAVAMGQRSVVSEADAAAAQAQADLSQQAMQTVSAATEAAGTTGIAGFLSTTTGKVVAVGAVGAVAYYLWKNR